MSRTKENKISQRALLLAMKMQAKRPRMMRHTRMRIKTFRRTRMAMRMRMRIKRTVGRKSKRTTKTVLKSARSEKQRVNRTAHPKSKSPTRLEVRLAASIWMMRSPHREGPQTVYPRKDRR